MSSNGALAQLVEHRTENPCVPGSIPGGTTPPFIMNPVYDICCSGVFSLFLTKVHVFHFIFVYLHSNKQNLRK